MIPADTLELLQHLERAYPPRCIRKDETPEEAHRYAGKVELIAELRVLWDRQARKGQILNTN